MREFEALTERGRLRRYRRALRDALAAYPVRVDSVRFVSGRSKPVFRVDTDTGSFAAKYHNPSEHDLAQMHGEMHFLQHVAEHTDLVVETPLPNRHGRLITEVRTRWLPQPAHVALCAWLPGRLLRDEVSPRSYRLLGESDARLHEASASFRPPRDFRILDNDRVFYWDAETILSRRDAKLLPRSRQERFRAASRFAERAIRRVRGSGRRIVIHNDFHPSNIKVHRGRLGLFDFEDIVWGVEEQDIGTAFYYVRFEDRYEELARAFRDGYEDVRAWPFREARDVDPFVAARALMLANYVVNYGIRPEEHLPRFEGNLTLLLETSG